MSDYKELVSRLRNLAGMLGNSAYETVTEAAGAIEALQNYAELHKNITEKTLAAAVKISKEVPQWIPVEERLPDECGHYLVFVKAGKYEQVTWYEIAYYDGKEKFYTSVTHWMPLPEPPKESTVYESIKTGLEQAINGESREELVTKEEDE